MHTSLTVKNTVIGSGRTKIAVPLVARTAAELAAVLPQIKNLPFDIVEFRADFLECAGSIGEVLRHAQTVRDALPDKPLLFTFRRHSEGGSFPCSDDYYFELLDALIESRLPDIIDIELFSGETAVRRAVANAQKNGIAALLCNHEFHRTPPQEEIVCRLKAVLEPMCTPYVPAIQRHLENVQAEKLFITPAARPRVTRVPHDDKVYHIIVRFASPVSKRLEIQQAVMDEFLRVQYRLLNPRPQHAAHKEL